jgi:Glyoxalase-like domain
MLRVRQLALVARDLDPVVDDLKAVFGVEVAFNDPGVSSFGLKNAVIPVGHQFVEVVAPIEENTAGGRYLDRRNGDGGYMVILQCDDHPSYKQRVDELGVRKVAEADEKNYSIMQLHPADTSGSFLEIDVQVGGEDFKGPWMPAGKNWQKAIRQEKVDGIAAAEVQSPDPAAVADRWSKILDIAVGTDDAGNPALTLDNATIRFVPAEDGRGEGLGGIDVIAVDKDAVLEAADKRGVRQKDDVLLMGGIRFRLV